MGGKALTIKGLHFVTKKQPGKPIKYFVYAWRGGPLVMTAVGGGRPSLSAAALTAYHTAVEKRRSHSPGTIADLATQWRSSPEWHAYAADTRKQWGSKLSVIQAKWGTVPLTVFEDVRVKAKIVAWRNALATSSLRGADMAIQVLRALFAYGNGLGLMTLNPAVGIGQLYKGGARANIIWEPIERWVMAAALSDPVADAFELANLTGFRRTDLVEVPLSAVGDDAITWATSKSGRRRIVTVPMIDPLRQLINDRLRSRIRKPGVGTLLVSSLGLPWTPDGLDSSFGDQRDLLGFDKHLHDCRGTYVTELCEAGLTDAVIAGIVGWSSARVADIRRIYVDQRRTNAAIGAAIRLRGEHAGNS